MIRLTIVAVMIGCAIALVGPGLANAGTPAATPLRAVEALVRPLAVPGTGTKMCDTLRGTLAGCPITTRLWYRLTHVRVGANLICRCQNPPSTVGYAPHDNNGQVAHVRVTWYYGPTTRYTTVFREVHRATGWLVDDMSCLKRKGTSIYTDLGPC